MFKKQTRINEFLLPGFLPLVPVATRYDKCAVHFLGAIHLAASVIWLN
jgi:hypothetical protein